MWRWLCEFLRTAAPLRLGLAAGMASAVLACLLGGLILLVAFLGEGWRPASRELLLLLGAGTLYVLWIGLFTVPAGLAGAVAAHLCLSRLSHWGRLPLLGGLVGALTGALATAAAGGILAFLTLLADAAGWFEGSAGLGAIALLAWGFFLSPVAAGAGALVGISLALRDQGR